MKGYLPLFTTIAFVCVHVKGYPYGNLSPEFIWDTTRCSNINPIVDSKTVILIAKGEYPQDKNCYAIRRDLKVSDDTAYTMSTDFINLSGERRSDGTITGHVGYAFNYWNDYNYDFVFIRTHRPDPGYGSVKNGVVSLVNLGAGEFFPDSGKWYNLKIEVLPSKDVTLKVNDQVIGSFKAHFTTRGYGGVLLINGFNNVAQFRDFDVSPVLA